MCKYCEDKHGNKRERLMSNEKGDYYVIIN